MDAPSLARPSSRDAANRFRLHPYIRTFVAARSAAVPDGFCWLTPVCFLALMGARSFTGFVSHGLTCFAITRTKSPAQSVV
jgi:hypothetical protein